MLATGWLAAGNTKLAAEHLKPLLRAPPLGARVADLQVRLLLASKEYAAIETALATAAQAKSLDAGSISQFYYHAATAVAADGKPEQAIRLLIQAEKLTPTSGVVLRSLAALHLNAGHKDQARQYYARLAELFPDADDIDQLRNRLAVLSDEKGGAK